MPGSCQDPRSSSLADSGDGPTKPTCRTLKEGDSTVTEYIYRFKEEALGMPWTEGFGYADLQFGQLIGERYRVERKLGIGRYSSIWLAWDTKDASYVAVKVLTGHATALNLTGDLSEVVALQRLAAGPLPNADIPSKTHCLQLLDWFSLEGIDAEGSRIALVTEVLGGDVRSLISSFRVKGQAAPIGLTKRIFHHVLQGLRYTHSCGRIHCDLKLDNIMLTAETTRPEYIAHLLTADPPRRHHPEMSADNLVIQAAVSQPLPLPNVDEAMERTYLLADFGHSQDALHQNQNEIIVPPLRPPEIFLGGPWSEKVDIWSFACLLLGTIASNDLFEYTANPNYSMDPTESILSQMKVLTGESFPTSQLFASRVAGSYFDNAGSLKKSLPQPPGAMIRNILRLYLNSDAASFHALASILEECLHLDPDGRPTAEVLLQNDWWKEDNSAERVLVSSSFVQE